jgi:SNF2 family DNA or RNA helicase
LVTSTSSASVGVTKTLTRNTAATPENPAATVETTAAEAKEAEPDEPTEPAEPDEEAALAKESKLAAERLNAELREMREEITRQGLARSHIVILEALLRLRQSCCDLRLLGDDNGELSASDSGKLSALLDMLQELVDEGRRVLLFSQFTSMLALIEAELQTRKIAYAKLTGSTQDRRTPVQRFQAGEFPVFLISLKAGGSGLNLTAADTVIHFDPWWNPAAEAQATDRAHRIGQTRTVTSIKLIAAGTIEERVMELQKSKSEMLRKLLTESDSVSSGLSLDVIKDLLRKD